MKFDNIVLKSAKGESIKRLYIEDLLCKLKEKRAHYQSLVDLSVLDLFNIENKVIRESSKLFKEGDSHAVLKLIDDAQNQTNGIKRLLAKKKKLGGDKALIKMIVNLDMAISDVTSDLYYLKR